jgi:hypothetical protein
VGDIVTAVDGEPVEQRLARLRKYVAASNAWSLERNLDRQIVRGPLGVDGAFHIRSADGMERDVHVRREEQRAPRHPDSSYKRLDHDLGYVDLAKLTPSEVDPMFDALASTRGIIFDMRGYPVGGAWLVPGRLDVRRLAHGASHAIPLVKGDDDVPSAEVVQPPLQTWLGAAERDKPLYRGRIRPFDAIELEIGRLFPPS